MSHVRLYWDHKLHIEGGVAPEERGWGWGGGGKRRRSLRTEETFHDLEFVSPWPRSFLHPSPARSGAHLCGSALCFSVVKTHLSARAGLSPHLARGVRVAADSRQTFVRCPAELPGATRGITGSARSITSDAPWWIDGTGRGCSRCSLRWFTQGQVGKKNLSSIKKIYFTRFWGTNSGTNRS